MLQHYLNRTRKVEYKIFRSWNNWEKKVRKKSSLKYFPEKFLWTSPPDHRKLEKQLKWSFSWKCFLWWRGQLFGWRLNSYPSCAWPCTLCKKTLSFQQMTWRWKQTNCWFFGVARFEIAQANIKKKITANINKKIMANIEKKIMASKNKKRNWTRVAQVF